MSAPCSRCGLPVLSGVHGYAGPQCRCWSTYGSQDHNRFGQARETRPLTEADVRRIVREELARDMEERRAKLRAFVAEVHGADTDSSSPSQGGQQ